MHFSACPDVSEETWNRLRLHISSQWGELTRSLKNAVTSAYDPKTAPAGSRVLIYVSAAEQPDEILRRLGHILEPDELARIDVRPLPGTPENITDHGLLYLPGRYVVPGGRFNELYGWDSYFIALGLLKDGRVGLAQSIADQLIYEVEHYGFVLNCNRSYCLTRSQPPLLGMLVRAVFAQTGDLAWLRTALPALERYHGYWQTPPHFSPAVGLSRYHALGEGPAPEVVQGELDAEGRNHYERVCEALRSHPAPDVWFPKVLDAATGKLTAAGYKNDRTVRESGFDLTHRFGFCGLDAVNHIPVCLNSLLWQMEKDIAEIRRLLETTPEAIAHWENLATARAARMEELFWDEDTGLFLDWHLERGARTNYPYATTFWPLWTGWASGDKAARVATQLPRFLAPGGLLASTETTGCQWDAPFTWAPLVLPAVKGLAAYGFTAEANEVKCRFIALVAREFQRTGKLFEKYDAREQTSEVGEKIRFGYPTNEPGFGWTNGVLAELIS